MCLQRQCGNARVSVDSCLILTSGQSPFGVNAMYSRNSQNAPFAFFPLHFRSRFNVAPLSAWATRVLPLCLVRGWAVTCVHSTCSEQHRANGRYTRGKKEFMSSRVRITLSPRQHRVLFSLALLMYSTSNRYSGVADLPARKLPHTEHDSHWTPH